MPLPLIPLAIGSLAAAAFAANKARESKKVMSAQTAAERMVIYDTALNTCKDSAKLRTLALAFEKAGQKPEATMLRKRADLMDAPKELKQARRESLAKGLASTNKAGVLNLANAYEEIGATAAAAKLRAHAETLDVSKGE